MGEFEKFVDDMKQKVKDFLKDPSGKPKHKNEKRVYELEILSEILIILSLLLRKDVSEEAILSHLKELRVYINTVERVGRVSIGEISLQESHESKQQEIEEKYTRYQKEQ